MQTDQVFNVVGIREQGDRVVITENTTHEIAERIVSLMAGSSAFLELLIESVDGSEKPSLETAHA